MSACLFGRLLRGLLLSSLLLLGGAHAQSTSTHGLNGDESDAPAGARARYLLVGPDGGAVSDEDFRGRFQLITFGYTFCPDVCPTTLVDMAEVLRLLGDKAANVQGIFISVDPERDTPKTLSTYTKFFDTRILGLTGSAALVERAAKNFKVKYAKVPDSSGAPNLYAVDHSAGLYLLGKNGEFIKKIGYGTPPEQIAADLQAIIGN